MRKHSRLRRNSQCGCTRRKKYPVRIDEVNLHLRNPSPSQRVSTTVVADATLIARTETNRHHAFNAHENKQIRKQTTRQKSGSNKTRRSYRIVRGGGRAKIIATSPAPGTHKNRARNRPTVRSCFHVSGGKRKGNERWPIKLAEQWATKRPSATRMGRTNCLAARSEVTD